MRTYILYVHDDRYSAPTLDIVTVRDDLRATEIAAKRLASSTHYRVVEMWDENEQLVCRIDRSDLAQADDR